MLAKFDKFALSVGNRSKKYCLPLSCLLLLAGIFVLPPSPAQGQTEVSQIQQDLNQDKNFNKALDRLQDLLKREPNNVEAHMMCGKVLQALGYEGLANEQYSIADKLDPSQPDSVLSLFHNRLQTQGPAQAYEYLQYVQKRFPRDPSVLIMQGMMERMRGDEKKAEYFYSLALDHNPDTPGLATTVASLRLVDASKLLDKARDPLNLKNKQELFAQAKSKINEAMKLADRDLKLKKDQPTANLAKGQCLFLLDRYADAIPYLQDAMKGVQNKKSVADILSRAFIRNGQFGEAIEPTLICLSLTKMKEHFEVDQLKGRLSLILRHVNPDELLNTIKVLAREIRYQETLANIYYASGDVLDKSGFVEQAQEAFSAGLKLYPYSGRPFLRMGILLERKGDYQKAMQNYERAYQLSPADREVAAHFVRLLKRAPAQQSDLAWNLKDMMRGGRVSALYKARQ